MIDILTLMGGAVLAVMAAWWAGQRKGRKTERKAVQDDMNEAYNDTTKEVRDATDNLPDDPDDVLDGLRRRGTRGQGKRDP